MNIVRGEEGRVQKICRIIAEDIDADLLSPADVLALSTGLLKTVLCDLIGQDKGCAASDEIESIVISSIKNNCEQYKERVNGKDI